MFSTEIKKLLVEVISSWQVWAVTGVLVLYVFLINYVARLYHRRRPRDTDPLGGPDMPEITAEPKEQDNADYKPGEETPE